MTSWDDTAPSAWDETPVAAEPRYAGFWIRVLATILDSDHRRRPAALCCWSAWAPTAPPPRGSRRSSSPSTRSSCGCSGARTIGGRILGLRLVRVDGQPVTYGTSIARYLMLIVSYIALLLGVIWVGFDKRKQGWMDKTAGTYVIRDLMTRDDAIRLAYLAAAILFILGLKFLSTPRTARRGNVVAAVGMLVAIVATLCDESVVSFTWIIIGIAVGTVIGAVAAQRVKMTAMPQMVALFNGVGGGAAALIAASEYHVAADAGVESLDAKIAVSIMFSADRRVASRSPARWWRSASCRSCCPAVPSRGRPRSSSTARRCWRCWCWPCCRPRRSTSRCSSRCACSRC